MIKSKIINSGLAQTLRHKVLREGKPFDSAHFKEDGFKDTIHIGAYSDNILVGVCSLINNNNTDIKLQKQYQLRGMAVDTKAQGKGVGKAMLRFVEQALNNLNIEVVWCNSRIIARRFYASCGFIDMNKNFDIPKIGVHAVMYKNLS